MGEAKPYNEPEVEDESGKFHSTYPFQKLIIVKISYYFQM